VPALSFSPTPDAASTAYCRQARRLRAKFRRDPGRLQVALRELSAVADAGARRARVHCVPETSAAEAELIETGRRFVPADARVFSARVAAALSDGVLRYADRKDLLQEAARAGIGRFEATLLIAAVQHREADVSRPAPRRYTLAPRSSRLIASPIVFTALLLQGLIAGAAWWVIHV
jgi:hypothetical protein